MNEEWVVCSPSASCDGLRRGMSELVVVTDDETLKVVELLEADLLEFFF